MIQVLIAVSQLINACLGGDADEMLSSRAWRCRNESHFWSVVRWVLDNFSPLMWWRDGEMTHCESCWYAEAKRWNCSKHNTPISVLDTSFDLTDEILRMKEFGESQGFMPCKQVLDSLDKQHPLEVKADLQEILNALNEAEANNA